jgi:hypothetical protein
MNMSLNNFGDDFCHALPQPLFDGNQIGGTKLVIVLRKKQRDDAGEAI